MGCRQSADSSSKSMDWKLHFPKLGKKKKNKILRSESRQKLANSRLKLELKIVIWVEVLKQRFLLLVYFFLPNIIITLLMLLDKEQRKKENPYEGL